MSLLKTGSLSMKNVFKLLAKCILIALGLTVKSSTTDKRINKRSLGSATAVIISNKQIEYIMKIVMSLVDSDSGPYIKDSDTKAIEIKTKEQMGRFSGILIHVL